VENGKVIGIVTNRDTRFETNLDQPVSAIMTPQARLVTVKEGASLEEARAADAQAPPRARAGAQ
jgi:IMP dehydrogenase